MKGLEGKFWSIFLCFSLFFCDATIADKHRQDDKKGKKDKNQEASSEVKVVRKIDLPEILREISGMAYLGQNRFACVQDEAGAIFIFNSSNSKIEKQVAFGAAGDYEGLALVGKTAYVIRSDGKLFEITNMDSNTPKITDYDTGLTASNDVEGLTYDAKQNRLLLAIKGAEAGSASYKGIYAFDLDTKKLSKTPVYKIDLTDPVFKNSKGKNPTSAMNPSEIAVNPTTGHLYVTEGTHPQLIILDSSGKIVKHYKLNNTQFPQPEGLAFSPGGQLFISNEGAKSQGTILEVQLADL